MSIVTAVYILVSFLFFGVFLSFASAYFQWRIWGKLFGSKKPFFKREVNTGISLKTWIYVIAIAVFIAAIAVFSQ